MGDRNSKCPAFSDNWSYIKTELQWLDRLLLLAVGRQRRDRRETERVSRNKGDRLTHHWWKGIVNLEGPARYEDGRPDNPSPEFSPRTQSQLAPGARGESARSKKSASKKQGGYQKQLEGRIQASRALGVKLALPALRDRLQLTLFEKNLLILGLAPEVNRRYARLYAYLQDNETSPLPQVDLALKLLCRNDQEWYTARRRLVEDSPLLQSGLVTLVAPDEQPLLTHRVKLSAELVNYLLANPMDENALEGLLTEHQLPLVSEPTFESGTVLTPAYPPSLWSRSLPSPQIIPPPKSGNVWSPLVLPRLLKRELKHLSQRLQLLALDPPEALATPQGTWAILAGPEGIGKAMAAQAIAHGAQTQLMRVNLNDYDDAQLCAGLAQVQAQAPTVLLIESAERLLTARSTVAPRWLQQFLSQRQQQPCLTLLSVTQPAWVAPQWLRQCDRLLHFPLPDTQERIRLWKRAFPKNTDLDPRISWEKLAAQGKLTGAQIQAVARDAMLYAQTEGKSRVTLRLIQRAWRQRLDQRSPI